MKPDHALTAVLLALMLYVAGAFVASALEAAESLRSDPWANAAAACAAQGFHMQDCVKWYGGAR